jgi:hypothetical protein
MKAINITAYTENPEHLESIKAFFKSLKIKFEVTKQASDLYDQDFVKKIKQGDDDLKAGRGRVVTLEELENLCK